MARTPSKFTGRRIERRKVDAVLLQKAEASLITTRDHNFYLAKHTLTQTLAQHIHASQHQRTPPPIRLLRITHMSICPHQAFCITKPSERLYTYRTPVSECTTSSLYNIPPHSQNGHLQSVHIDGASRRLGVAYTFAHTFARAVFDTIFAITIWIALIAVTVVV